MSRASIRREIRKYEKLKSECEDRLSELEEQLEHLLNFRSRYDAGKQEFNDNLSNRKKRADSVREMSEHVKCGQRYYEGMNDDLTGDRNVKTMHYVERVSERIESVKKLLEYEIEQEKLKIHNYSERIEELYRRLSREDD